MKIQISKDKSVEWTPPWEKKASVEDVIGVELASGHSEGCPAVRLQRRRGVLSVACVGFVPAPNGELPNSWDELRHQPKWSVPAAFRAECAALTINSTDSVTRQTSADPFLVKGGEKNEGVATSKDGTRSVFRRMADEGSVLQVTLPEYQVLWLNRLLPEGRRPTAVSIQTTACSLLAALAAQPSFCASGDETVLYVTQSTVRIAGFRKGVPLLYRECTGAGGAAAMRQSVKTSLGLDDSMLDAVFSSNGIIDTRPALEPLLAPVVSQVEQTVSYLKSRLGSDPKRILLMGDATGCGALKRIIGERLPLPLETPNPFDGLELPVKTTTWKDRYCVGEMPQVFLAALGAALAVLGEESK